MASNRAKRRAHSTVATESPQSAGLLERLRVAARARQLSRRTEQAYVHWTRRFVDFHGRQHPRNLDERDINAFVTYLAAQRNVSASTQSQALAALLFLYREVLGRNLGSLGNLIRVQRPRKQPLVLSLDEVRRVLAATSPDLRLFFSLLYGAGLRLLECLRLRVKDVDLELQQIVVRDGKGNKDRITVLPSTLKDALALHLAMVKTQHLDDRRAGFGQVHLPGALSRKFPTASNDWSWQYVFPAASLSIDPWSGRCQRHHLQVRTVQRAFARAVRASGITKPASCHTLRHNAGSGIMPGGIRRAA